jgi:hypothetical protein
MSFRSAFEGFMRRSFAGSAIACVLLAVACGSGTGGAESSEAGADQADGVAQPDPGVPQDVIPPGEVLPDVPPGDVPLPDVPPGDVPPVDVQPTDTLPVDVPPDLQPDTGPAVSQVEILPIGVDLLAVGQTIPLKARVLGATGQELSGVAVTWLSSNESLLTVDASGKMTGITYGGGSQLAADGKLFVTAKAGGVESAPLVMQVVRPTIGSGISFVVAPMSPDPGTGEPGPGRDHYDGLYPVAIVDSELNKCNLYKQEMYWNPGTKCTWNRADGRLFVEGRLFVQVRAFAQVGTFEKKWLEFPQPLDESGKPLAPAEPRPLWVEWSSTVPSVATVEDGVVTAVGPGKTAILAVVGPQTFVIKLVVYPRFGYRPWLDFAPGAQSENGYLAIFSSSHRQAALGTLDTVRVMDLNDYKTLDYRPSKYGPQGKRLVQETYGQPELFGGGGCGMVRGAGDIVWLLSDVLAIPFDVKTMTQEGGLHKVAWRPDGDADSNGARQMCQAVFYESPQYKTSYLIGFDLSQQNAPQITVRTADVTGLAGGEVLAKGLDVAPFNLKTVYYNPQLWKSGIDGDYVLYMEQGSPNVLHFARIQVDPGADHALTLVEQPARAIKTAPTPDDPKDVGEAPGLIVTKFKGKDYAFVGNQYTVTVVDLAEGAIVGYGDPANPLTRDLDIRWYGEKVRAFAVSADGKTLFALPYTKMEGPDEKGVFRGKVQIEYKDASGSVKTVDMTSHRVALIDLAPAGDKPVLREDSAKDPHHCYKSFCANQAEGLRFGIDLLHVNLKKWMINSGLSPSSGAVPPVLGLNVRAMVASEKSLFLIGRDHPDGVGTALANLSDLAVYDLQTGEGIVFRGWRSDPATLMGLSDPFGFRLAEKDAVMGDNRVKNAGLVYIPGPRPPQVAGDGPPPQPDLPLPTSDNFANAPDAVPETGSLFLLSSSHAAASDGTMDVIRRLDLSNYGEEDFDPSVAGAQGVGMTYAFGGKTVDWGYGCGTARGPGNKVFLFSGDAAVLFDLDTLSQAAGGHQVTFDSSPTPKKRVCAGAYYENGATRVLYAVDLNAKPDAPLLVADVSGLDTASVKATAVVDPFLEPDPAVDDYPVRYVTARIVDKELWLLEKNDPRHLFRNTVHRVQIGMGGALTFDSSRASDLVGAYTESGDPDFIVADFKGHRHLFIGNEMSITVYDMAAAPVRVDYNADGDAVIDDLDTWDFGRGIQTFAPSPDGMRLFALPWQKSARMPMDQYIVPLGGSGTGTRTQDADRYRVAVIDLDGTGMRPEFDPEINNGNGIDLVYFFLKQYLISDWVSPGAVPPIFPFFARKMAVSTNSLFLIGNDYVDGAGSALANMTDLAIYDIATGRGTIWRNWVYEGLSNASSPFGYRLGVDPATGAEDANLKGARVKNAGVLFVP